MLRRGDSFPAYDNSFLTLDFDYVSADVDNASVAHSETSGRGGRGGITFTPGNNSHTFAYDQFVQEILVTPDAVLVVGLYVNQPAPQGSLGGRLLTFIDTAESILGTTTQVGIDILPGGALRIVRATTAGTGVVLRSLDQGSDSQVTLLGTSSSTIPAGVFLEARIIFHNTNGSVTIVADNAAFFSVSGVNTAPSGRNLGAGYCIGGYVATDLAGATRLHYDLNAVISDLHVVDSVVSVTDPNSPTDLIGDHSWKLSEMTADGALEGWTPNPVRAHYLNINENPPDKSTTENTTNTLDNKDDFASSDIAGTGTDKVLTDYRALVRSDSDSSCVTGEPALFEAFVYTEQTDPGEVHTTPPTGAPCNLSDFVSGRAQTICTISRNGDKVSFKPLSVAVQADEYFVGLSPLNAPPRLQTPQAPGYYAAAGFHPKTPIGGGFVLGNNVNVIAVPGSARYDAPWYQPWRGIACDDQDELRLAGDFFEFNLNEDGIGIDVGLVNTFAIAAPFNPYSTPLIAFHFREDIEGSPYFWISPSFAYAGETIHTHSTGDRYRIVRNDPNIELYQNATLLGTFTTGGPLDTVINPYTFMGRWGFVTPFGRIRQPGIKNAFVHIGSSACCPAHFNYNMLAGAFRTDAKELQQWGVRFNANFPDAFIYDPGSTHGPFPDFGLTVNTRCEFSLEGGNVVLRIYDSSFLDGIPDVGGVGTWTYTRPFANTNNFALQGTPPAVGPPNFPTATLEYAFPTPGANAPLRLVIIRGADNGGVPQGVKEVSFTFADGTLVGPAAYAGFLRQGGSNKAGTSRSATPSFRLKHSTLASNTTDDETTLAEFNAANHGYTKSE